MNYITTVVETIIDRLTSKNSFGNSKGIAFNIGKFRFVLAQKVLLRNSGGRISAFMGFAWKRKRGSATIIPSLESNPHIVIFGMSGQGKSTLLRRMVADISSSGKPAVIFDAHNEHESLVVSLGGRAINASESGLNIFSLEGSSVGERISELTALFRKVYSLGYIQSVKLGECMWYSYRKCGAMGREDTQIPKTPTLNDVLLEMGVFIRNSKSVSEKNSLTHMRSKLSSLASQSARGESFEISDITSGVSSFSLAGLRSEEAQIIYINELLRRLYISMKAREKENGISLYVVIDEAQFIINDSDSQILKKLVEEGRKYGVGTIIATHMASRLPKEIIANASTFITFYPREPQEINYLTSLLSSGIQERADEVRKMLRRLRRNEAMVMSYSLREPCVIATSGAQAFRASPPHGPVQPISARKPVKVDEWRAGDYTNAQKLEIGSDGNSEKWVMERNGSLSIEHEVSVRKIFEELDSEGIRSIIVDNSSGPDLIAFLQGRKIAVEYETGKKSIKSTANMIDRRSREFYAVLIAVNENAYAFYKNYFERDNVKVVPYRPGAVKSAIRELSDGAAAAQQNNNVAQHIN